MNKRFTNTINKDTILENFLRRTQNKTLFLNHKMILWLCFRPFLQSHPPTPTPFFFGVVVVEKPRNFMLQPGSASSSSSVTEAILLSSGVLLALDWYCHAYRHIKGIQTFHMLLTLALEGSSLFQLGQIIVATLDISKIFAMQSFFLYERRSSLNRNLWSNVMILDWQISGV